MEMREIDASLPLICDLDGTLIKTDSLHENILSAMLCCPDKLLSSISILLHGRAAWKAALTNISRVDAASLPYCDDVLALLRDARAGGRKTYLVTAADQSIADDVASHVKMFDGVKGSDAKTNLKGANKLIWLKQRFPQGFIYAGDSFADLPIWQESAGAILVGRAARFADQLGRKGVSSKPIRPDEDNLAASWLRELRLHQWSKNALIFIPIFLGHIANDPQVWVRTLMAFFAFGLVASATYIVNDIVDLESDRAHPTKRHRPIAAGRISLGSALMVGLFLFAAGFGISVALSIKFTLVVLVYLLLTLSYSFKLKKLPMIDVTVIGALFTLRIVMGQVLNGLLASPWLLSFSALFFFSLALAKRHVEVLRSGAAKRESVKGRGYVAQDWPLTLGFGLSSAIASIVIMLLFVALDGNATHAYQHPVWLYVAPAGVFIWLQRIWLLSQRMELNDDPIVFALKDKMSYVIGFLVAVSFVLAL